MVYQEYKSMAKLNTVASNGWSHGLQTAEFDTNFSLPFSPEIFGKRLIFPVETVPRKFIYFLCLPHVRENYHFKDYNRNLNKNSRFYISFIDNDSIVHNKKMPAL